MRTDVSKRADNDALVEAAERFGGVDVMVANAGITLRSDGADVTEEDYRRLMAVNLDGTLFGAQAAARQMKAKGKAGSIVLMASMGGIVGAGMTVAYSTSKGGVVLMAKALADALGPDGIRVNAVAPGTIDTNCCARRWACPMPRKGSASALPCAAWASRRRSPTPWYGWGRTCRATRPAMR
ncbi:MAG: 3-ketoacyl-ACP reductase [Massilia sp.]|nr:3-ketoacyl-ACP reductase [Massilia sp.]